jgi:hypothetical protein
LIFAVHELTRDIESSIKADKTVVDKLFKMEENWVIKAKEI